MSEQYFNLLQKAEHLTEIERWREAIPLLSKALATEPESHRANCLLSLCFYQLKDFDSALKYAEKAIWIDPEEEWGHRLRSIILGELGRKKEALKSAEEAARLAPFYVSTIQTLIMAYLETNKLRQAKEIAEKMREDFPESDETFFALGIVYLRINNPFEAEKNFREALRLNPNNSNARNNLGTALLEQERSKPTFNSGLIFNNVSEREAIEHYTEAMKLEPNNEYVIQTIKAQFSYSTYFFLIISLIPFFLLAFFVIPRITLTSFVILFLGFINICSETYRQKRKLSPEIKMLLKAGRKTFFADKFNEFKSSFERIVLKNWQPHLLALGAIFVRFSAELFDPGNSAKPLIIWFSTAITITSGVWLAIKIKKS